MVELEIKETKKIDEGKHTGKITRIEYRTEPYEYTDIFIQVDGDEIELKYGCPTNVSPQSKLGKLLSKFTVLVPGERVDPEKVLVGKRLQFMTVNEETEQGTFARIVGKSVRPVAKEKKKGVGV